MYPMSEDYTDIISVAFRNALQDAAMLEPTSVGTNPLFPPAVVDIRLGGDAAMTGSDRQITMPIPGVILTIGRAYGREQGFVGDTYKDVDAYLQFTVWAMTEATQDDMEKRLYFARDHRQNVFSSYKIQAQLLSKPRPSSPITGLSAVDYTWRWWYART